MNRINLLPESFKQDQAQAKKNKEVLGYVIKAAIILVVALASSLGLHYYLKDQLNSHNETIRLKEQGVVKYGNLESEAKSLSERLQSIEKIDKSANNWSSVIAEVQEVMPSGAYLSSVDLSADPKIRNNIAGFSESKAIVAALRSAMEESSFFEYVDIESSNLVEDPETEKEVENFVISFSLTKEALDE